jgi:WD40 repeat protein
VAGYEILSTLGRGGMGVVYQARQTKLNRLVALKMILAGGHAGEADLARFATEAEAIARLQHPNIVQVYEVGAHEGRPFFSLEFCAGGSLDRKLGGTPLPPVEAARLVETLARAMHAAHQANVIHRDLKPANVLLLEDGTPKITDFGLAKKLDEVGQTQSGAIMGTPSYMAPEQAGGPSKQMGPAVDVYALGAILYECLTGRPPFKAATALDTLMQVVADEPVPPTQLQSKTPKDLETICLKCLQKEPTKRYASSAALADDLGRFRAGEPIRARPVGRLERVVKWVRRNPAVAGLTAAVLLVLVAGTLVSTLFAVDARWQANETAREKRQAEDNLTRAEEKEREAVAARRETAGALRKAETSLYVNSIALAHREWLGDHVSRAEQALDECPIALRHWEWHYLERLCHRELLTLPGHEEQYILSVIFSPDGRRVASASGNVDGKGSTVKVWDAASGRELHVLHGTEGIIQRLLFSPDGKRLTTLGLRVQVWDLAGNKEPRPLPSATVGGVRTALSPDEKRLAATDGLNIKIQELGTGRIVAVTPAPKTNPRILGVDALSFSNDGRRLASSGQVVQDNMTEQRSEVVVWDAADGKELHALRGHTGKILGLAFSPDNRRLASSSADGTVKVWDVAGGKEVFTLRGHADQVTSVAFSPDGKRLASGSGDKTMKVWDAVLGKELFTYRGHTGAVMSVAFGSDGQRVASGSLDRTVKVWDVTTGQEARTVTGFARGPERITSLLLSPDRRQFLTSALTITAGDPPGLLHEVRLWDLRTGREVRTFFKGAVAALPCLAFSPDGRHLAVSHQEPQQGEKGRVIIYDAASGKEVAKLASVSGATFSLAFSGDGQLLAVGEGSGPLDEKGSRVSIWDVATGREVVKLPALPQGLVPALAFSSRGDRIAAAILNAESGGPEELPGEARVWDVATGKEVFAIREQRASIFCVAFSPDDKQFAAAGGDMVRGEGEVTVCDSASGRRIYVLRGHTKPIVGLTFSPDGRRLITGSQDRTVKVWDTVAAQELITLRGHGGQVRVLGFTPDGERLISACDEGGFAFFTETLALAKNQPWQRGEVKIWDATPLPAQGRGPAKLKKE